MSAASESRGRADDIVHTHAHIFAYLRLIGWPPSINELKIVDRLLNRVFEALDHFWVCAKQMGQHVGDHNPHGEDFRSFSYSGGHLACSLAAALRALEGSLPTAAYRSVLP
jgi:hypothetical protein